MKWSLQRARESGPATSYFRPGKKRKEENGKRAKNDSREKGFSFSPGDFFARFEFDLHCINIPAGREIKIFS